MGLALQGVRGTRTVTRARAGSGRAAFESVIGFRARFPEVSNANVQANTQAYIPISHNVSRIKLVWANFRLANNSAFELGNNGALDVICSVSNDTGGSWTQASFPVAVQVGGDPKVGRAPAVSSAGATSEVGVVTTDWINKSCGPATPLLVRGFLQNASGLMHVAARDSVNGDLLRLAASGLTDLTLGGTITHNGGTTYIPPCAVLGETTDGGIIIVGDSIYWGVANAAPRDSNYREGIVGPGLPTDKAWLRLASPGIQATDWVTKAPGRLTLMSKGAILINGLGVNDLIEVSARTAAQLSTDYQTIAGYATNARKKIACTITPRTSDTTTGYTTTAAQTASLGNNTGADGAAGGARLNWNNNYVRAIAIPGYTDYIDVASVFEDTATKTKWEASARARSVTDAAATAASTQVTSATANFAAADQYYAIRVAGAGAAGAQLLNFMNTITNSTTIQLPANASTTVTGATAHIGGRPYDGLHPTRGAEGEMSGHSIFTGKFTLT